ncbi:cytochrome d ubiquinol oxidase subunit II [Inhella sp.]|uniref:cytochrome d ubiquinol oxidase subunit II n=1 Tax=Inhella sp. TaxID=1921806 RepID=UPI0035AE637D
MNAAHWLPQVFLALMGLAMLAYVVLDGYDLGVGLLLPRAGSEADKDLMVASIGPFWDANETWLVLGVGVLLIAFPKAHGLVLTALYLPVAVMLIGLTLRGVAFDFRSKAEAHHKGWWNAAFVAGSGLAAAAQGWMLGRYITGFAEGWAAQGFALLIALALPAAYVMLGASWLLMKTEGPLQQRARHWARQAWWPVLLGIGLISIATPIVSATVRERWFALPEFIALLPIPLCTLLALGAQRAVLKSERVLGRLCWLPFALSVLLLVLASLGLAYSLYPYVVMDRLTLWQAASHVDSLIVIGIGCAITVPAIVGYTVFAYRVFWGKATELHYG